MPVYAWKIFFENAIEMVSIIPSNRARTTTTWQAKEINGNISCSLLKGYRAFKCTEHRFLFYRFIGLYTTKMKAEQTAILYPERSKCAPV